MTKRFIPNGVRDLEIPLRLRVPSAHLRRSFAGDSPIFSVAALPR
jgi:hypothetical protein